MLTHFKFTSKSLSLLVLILISGCSDKITNVYESIEVSTGVIYGRVTPYDAGNRVEARLGTFTRMKSCDSLGFFTVDSLNPGQYQLRLYTPLGLTHAVGSAVVESGRATDVGILSAGKLPQPFMYISPSDGDSSVQITSSFFILSESPLQIESLRKGVTFEPSTEGEWYAYVGDDGDFYYYFNPTAQFRSETDYTVQIDGSFNYTADQSWTDTIIVRFRTQGFHLDSYEGGTNLAAVPPNFPANQYYALLRLHFSELVPSSSFQYIRSEPPYPMIKWHDVGGPLGPRSVYIRMLTDLVPDSKILFIIDSGMPSMNGGVFRVPDTIHVQVQPLIATAFRFNGDTLLEPKRPTLGALWFNALVDPDSLDRAATFSPYIPGFWYRDPQAEKYQVRFYPTDTASLIDDQVYTLSIDSTIGLASGKPLKLKAPLSFRTLGAFVRSTSPGYAIHNVVSTVDIVINFNLPMDRPSTEQAFKLMKNDTIPVSGVFNYYGPTYDGNYGMSFNPDSNLTYGLYRYTLDTTALSQSGKNLKKGVNSFFSVGF